MLIETELMHFGVKGMKWGHRKSITNTSNNVKTKKNNIDSSEKNKMSSGKKIAIGAGVTATLVGGTFAAKKFSDITKNKAYTKHVEAGKKAAEKLKYQAVKLNKIESIKNNFKQARVIEGYSKEKAKNISSSFKDSFKEVYGKNRSKTVDYLEEAILRRHMY